jgi:hypothetical protein
MRLIDLHCNWAVQYACESSQYEAALYADIPSRLEQVDGYLTATATATLVCNRRAADWAKQVDPWHTLGEMIARYQAEFSGRLLHGFEDAARWKVEPPDGITWGMLGIHGLDFLVREQVDLDRLPSLFVRGMRVFQLVDSGSTVLGGAAVPGDDRGLTALEARCLTGWPNWFPRDATGIPARSSTLLASIAEVPPTFSTGSRVIRRDRNVCSWLARTEPSKPATPRSHRECHAKTWPGFVPSVGRSG